MSLSPKFLNLQPEKVFLWLGGFFGLLFLFLTPPMQVPDEPAHFLRAWQISEGNLFADREDNRVGGWMPLSLEKFSHPYWHTIFPGLPVTIDTLISSSRIETNAGTRKFKDFNNTALYSPVCYAPQATGIFLCRVFGVNPFYCFYAGRLFALLTWLSCVFFAIRTMPFQRWLMAILALLPMSVYQNMSFSADVMTNAVTFMFVAFILRYAYDLQPVDRRRLLILAAMCFLLVSVKSIYCVLLLLLLLIPRYYFGGPKHYFLKMLMLLIVSLGSVVLWTSLLKPALITYEEYNPNFRDDLSIVAGANSALQLNYILKHGLYIFDVVGRSIISAFNMYSTGYIGTFGWLSVKLPVVLVVMTYFFLIALAFNDANRHIRIRFKDRVILIMVFVMLFFFIFISQHLIWDPVGGSVISNIQGRYLIPVMPLFFIAFKNNLLRHSKTYIVFALVFFIFLLSFSALEIFNKYFGAE
jgi:uncharacterized membrane protein